MIPKLPWKVTGNHAIQRATAVTDSYEDYHVVSGNRVIVEMCDRDNAEYIVKACNMFPKFVSLLENLDNAETYELRAYLSDVSDLLAEAKEDI